MIGTSFLPNLNATARRRRRAARPFAEHGAQAEAASLTGITTLGDVVHHTRDVINAAIIAAQAGDQGYGFAVVAVNGIAQENASRATTGTDRGTGDANRGVRLGAAGRV